MYRKVFFTILLFVVTCCVSSMALAQKSGVSATVLNLPSGPGSLGGVGENVQANLNMGLMSYPITMVIPKGRGDATPEIGISYSSSAGSGLVGIGWAFNAGGSVDRLTVRGLPTYTSEDRFFAGGELVKVPGSSFYRSRVEGGFTRYRWVQKDEKDQRGYWVGENPDGSKSYYGANSQGELDLDSQVYGLQGTFRWELRTFVDRNGNRIEYTYFKDGTQVYMDTISWTFDKDNKPLYQVKLAYESRPDPISDGKPGFDLQTLKRIKEISVFVSGQSFRSYRLEFEDSTGLSRLRKVTRYGRDGKSVYPTVFTMKYSNATFSEQTSRLVTMPTALGIDFANRKADFLDINGDGLPDVIDTSKSNHVFHINTLTLDENMQQKAHDFSQQVKNPDATSGAELSSASVQMIDYNGDGFTDMVDAVNKAIYINKGNGKWESNKGAFTSFPIDGKDANMRFFDYNGDKAIDVISSNGSTTTYWVSDKKGAWVRVDGRPNLGVSVSKDNIRFLDINGDGLNDAIQILKNSLRYKKHLGYGNWSDWIDVKVPQIDKYELSTKAQFADINGDGMADMVAFLGSSIVYFVNKNGKEFSEPQQIASFAGNSIPNSTKNSVRIADMNGNGSRDIVWIDSNGKITYLELFTERPNLLREISNGIGQRINVEYGSSVYFYLRDKTCDKGKDKACDGPWENKMPMAFTLVTAIKTWASQSSDPTSQSQPKDEERPRVQKIFYHHGFYDGQEKQFRGFRRVESIYVGDDSVQTRYDMLEYNVGDQDVYFHGKMLKSIVMDEQKNIFNETRMEWKDCGTPAGADKGLDPPVRFICQVATETTVKEKLTDTSQWKVTRSETEYDTFGNITASISLGEKDKEGDELYILSEFIVPADPKSADSNWNIRSVKSVKRCEKRAGPCAEFRYYYDGEAYRGLPLGQVEKGNASRVAVKTSLTEDRWLDTQMKKYDAYGNVVERHDLEGRRRVIEWDSVYHKFPVKETVYVGNKSFTASTDWDYSLNAVVRSTDFNGHVSRYTYDIYGRILGMFQPGDPTDKPSVQYLYEVKAPLSKIITRNRSQQGGEQDREKIVCFDGLGRTIQERHKIETGRYLVFNHKLYNSTGQLAKVWNSYESDGGCSFLPPQNKQANATEYKYDSLQRLIRKNFAGGTYERMEYKPFVTVSYDEEDTRQGSPHFNTPETDITDGLGRVIESIKLSAPNQKIVTKYTYSSVNAKQAQQIKTMTYPDGSVKTHEYNLLGHLTRITDPDRSTIEYKYDDAGNMIEQKDGRGRITVYTYDDVGRVLTRQEKGKEDTKVTYFYDTTVPEMPDAKNLKGRLAKLVYPNGMITASYDANGSAIHSRHTLMGVTFDFQREFNNSGDLVSETWPDGRKVTYTYDQAGRLVSVPGLIANLTYDTDNLLISRTMANKVTSTFSYNARKWLQKIAITSQPGFQLELTHDGNGNITQTKENYRDKTLSNTYTYDALYRLTQASLQHNNEVLKYTQNELHNITSKISSLGSKSIVNLGAYKYDEKQIHAATQIGNTKLSYDKAGYVVTHGKVAHEWDYMGRMTATSLDAQVQGRYWYGDDLLRVAKEESGVHAFYPFQNFRIQNGYASIFLQHGADYVVEWRSTSLMAKFFDDVAPATGDNKLTPKADGVITAADAWLYHAAREKILDVPLKNRSVAVDLTRDMLNTALYRMLHGKEDQKIYLHTDHLGSIRVATDKDGKVQLYSRYYPYGAVSVREGNVQTLGYQGTEYDALTRYNYFGARYQDASMGKWLSPDPMYATAQGTDDEWNSYANVSNNPLRNRDLDGFTSSDTTTEIVMGASIAASLVFAGMFTKIVMKNHFAQGKKMNTTQKLLAIGALANAMLGATALTFTISGEENGAYAAAIAMGALSTIRSIGVIYNTHRQHIAIKNYASDRYSKTRHKRAIGARIASTVMSAASTGVALYAQTNDTSAGGVPVGSIIAASLAVGAGIANMVAIKNSRAFGGTAGAPMFKLFGHGFFKAPAAGANSNLMGVSAAKSKRDAANFALKRRASVTGSLDPNPVIGASPVGRNLQAQKTRRKKLLSMIKSLRSRKK